MFLTEVKRVMKVCLYADVVPSLAGHRGIGKTDGVYEVGEEWEDSFTGRKGLPVIPLYCATQEVTDLIGFPIKIWEKTGRPVIEGEHGEGRIVTSWAEPAWWPTINAISKHLFTEEEERKDEAIKEQMKKDGASEDEIWLFWNRPKVIIFLDELKRAPRDVLQAMYPMTLSKMLHIHKLPRGSRIITADNYAGAYDVREPDEAFMSRFCHIDVETDIRSWYDFAVGQKVHSKITNFLTSNPTFLIEVPKDQEKASIKYEPKADPRSWGDLVNRIEKYGRKGCEGLQGDLANTTLKNAIRGCIGRMATEAYWAFSDASVSFEDLLNGKEKSLKAVLEKQKDDIERNKLKEKLCIESMATLKGRKFKISEANNLKKIFLEIDSKERVTAIWQSLFLLTNSAELDHDWVKVLIEDPKVLELIEHLLKKKNVE